LADTSYVVNDPSTVKLWSKYLIAEVLKNTWAWNFVGTGDDNLIQQKTETQKGAGDTIKYSLRMQMSGAGISGDSTLEGNEEAITTYQDSLIIDQLRHAHRSNGRMTEQRVTWNIRDEARMALADWWSDRLDTSWVHLLAGYTPQCDVRFTGLYAIVAPESTHIKRPVGATELADESISTTSTFTLSMLDKAVEVARTATPAIRPLRVGGKPMYAAFLHDYAVTDMRTNTSTGQWLDIQKAAMTGGEVNDNPIFNGSLGVYNGVIIHSDSRIPNGVSGATGLPVTAVRRNFVCGAQAAVVGFGQDNGPSKMTWDEKTFDYSNKLGVAAGMIWGLKKSVFNSADYGVIVIPTYAAAH
jgi:N4-gp56 family major capsid protein